MFRSKVASGSDHDVAQLDHGRNMCAKFELLLAYGHSDLARTKRQLLPAHPARMKTVPAQPWLWVKMLGIHVFKVSTFSKQCEFCLPNYACFQILSICKLTYLGQFFITSMHCSARD